MCTLLREDPMASSNVNLLSTLIRTWRAEAPIEKSMNYIPTAKTFICKLWMTTAQSLKNAIQKCKIWIFRHEKWFQTYLNLGTNKKYQNFYWQQTKTKQNPVQQNEVPQTNSFIQRQLLTVQFLLYSDKKMSASAIDVWKSKQSLGKSSPEKGCKVIKLMEPSPIQNLLRKREK